MKFISTRDINQLNPVNLREAVIKGLADDGGLFMPSAISLISKDELEKMPSMPLPEIASLVLGRFLGEAIEKKQLENICNEVFNFPVPLVEIEKNVFSLELFHGPTLAFKDVGARFMSRLMGSFSLDNSKEIKVVVATSGDTGSAVAAGFHGVKGIEVFILFPKGKVSRMQEKQLTTWGGNITAIEVEGVFDNCQKHVKSLLADEKLKESTLLTSANSINIARLLPQAVYYAYAWSRLQHSGKPIVISVPSGNFGNLTAGLLAQKIGIPIHHFIASTNINDVVPSYLNDGKFLPRPSEQTVSNAMDVGNPSNFERMLHLFHNDHQSMKQSITGYHFNDTETKNAIRDIAENTGYVVDPHGAVGYLGLKQFILNNHFEMTGVFLETAHPAKFPETVEESLGKEILVPERLSAFEEKASFSIPCANDYEAVKDILMRTKAASPR
ncbi:MAG: threonine synthase [Bacteroidales bacterium]|nr:threonine synthase [Bacteroidales bacterium]